MKYKSPLTTFVFRAGQFSHRSESFPGGNRCECCENVSSFVFHEFGEQNHVELNEISKTEIICQQIG